GQNIEGEEGERLVNGASAYQTTYDLSDKPVFERTIPRHIYAAWNPDNGNILQTIFNQEVVYGKSGATIPFGVLNYDFETPDALDQHVSTTQAPCAMNYTKFVLEPKGSIQSAKRVVSLITHTNSYEEANKIIRRFTSSKDFVDQKKKSGRKFINSIRHKVLTKMSSKYAVFTQYMGNNQLDNVLRGGLSIPIKTKKGIVSVNVLSRIHGDLERDYNWYLVLIMYYSQGIGAYRDMLQNMLNDAWVSNPNIPAAEGILDMLDLIQADGYNPKVVKPDVFKAESDEDVENALSKMVASNEEKEKLRDMMKNGFTLGELFGYIVENKLQSKQSNVESHEIQVFEDILLHTVKQKQADHGEGFWTDHWHYNLDSIEEYLRLNPDKREHLFFGKMFSYYLNNHSVRKRDHDDKGNGRYYYSQFKGRVIQPNSVINREDVKAEEKGNLLRTRNGEGEEYKSNLIVKGLMIISNKVASLDQSGV
ncbi:MAG: hypothetical protein KAJ14_07100, partial [Candidatus Omnitrophica bacterium]|nr:hypothetical protein [Candidatus Omnitrophota bacterium]